jgi:undecaprenyl diphosphate synthase
MDTAPVASGKPNPPVHVAIIMDGNGRWARARGLPRTAGHKRGAEAVRQAIEGAIRARVSYLTLFGFSSENWKRPLSEIADLMGLLRHHLRSELAFLHEHGIRLRVIGERARLDEDIVDQIVAAERETALYDRLTLTIALSYGGRAEITRAARSLAEQAAAGTLNPANVDEAVFAERLYTADMPDPDLLIRTSGAKRISNFLLWQLAYAELVFIDNYWPDFSREDFIAAVEEFHRRERRYGMAST